MFKQRAAQAYIAVKGLRSCVETVLFLKSIRLREKTMTIPPRYQEQILLNVNINVFHMEISSFQDHTSEKSVGHRSNKKNTMEEHHKPWFWSLFPSWTGSTGFSAQTSLLDWLTSRFSLVIVYFERSKNKISWIGIRICKLHDDGKNFLFVAEMHSMLADSTKFCSHEIYFEQNFYFAKLLRVFFCLSWTARPD